MTSDNETVSEARTYYTQSNIRYTVISAYYNVRRFEGGGDTETQTRTGSGASVEALLSVEDAAGVLGISPRTLESWVRAKKVPVVKMGRLTKFRPAARRQWIEAQEQQAAPVASGRE